MLLHLFFFFCFLTLLKFMRWWISKQMTLITLLLFPSPLLQFLYFSFCLLVCFLFVLLLIFLLLQYIFLLLMFICQLCLFLIFLFCWFIFNPTIRLCIPVVLINYIWLFLLILQFVSTLASTKSTLFRNNNFDIWIFLIHL